MATALSAIRPSHPTSGGAHLDDALAEFGRLRPRLLGIAHRIVGRWTEAEDVVQDAWLRWQAYDRSVVVNSRAFLVTTTSRLAMNAAQSARARRESCVGGWSAEPADTRDDPALRAERGDELAFGVQLMLQRLSPTERAAYVLRQAFEYPYAQIAGVLHTTEANARQLVNRAGKHLAAPRRHPAATGEHRRFMRAFVAAAQRGDVTALERLFATDANRSDDNHRSHSHRG
jgi:RNA polymerase sigma-70 factor (ECF subfamily)